MKQCQRPCALRCRGNWLLDDGVIAVCNQTLAHQLGVVPIVDRANLNVNEVVLLRICNGSIAAGAQCVHQQVGVLLMGDGSNLNEIIAACGR